MAAGGTPWDLEFKFILLGDVGVGKSCIAQQFKTKTFSSHYMNSIGGEFLTKTIDVSGQRIKLNLWDTAGDERFKSVVKSFFREATGALLVYDVTKPLSLRGLAEWWRIFCKDGPPIVKAIVVGNKCDLETHRRVSYDEGRAFADEHGLLFIEVSAKTGDRVDDAFVELADRVRADVERGEYDLTNKAFGIKRGYNPDRDGIPDERGELVPIRRDSKVDGTSSESKKVEGGCC